MYTKYDMFCPISFWRIFLNTSQADHLKLDESGESTKGSLFDRGDNDPLSRLSFSYEKPGPLGRVRMRWLCLQSMCDSAIPISQGHIYFVRGKLPHIWGLNRSREIPRRLVAQTPNMGSQPCPVEFF